MSKPTTLYTVKWPKAADHRTRSLSGVVVETNAHHQVAFHFYNETRELEEEVEYDEHGVRATEARGITYKRELADTLLLNESTARELRDALNALFPEVPSSGVSH